MKIYTITIKTSSEIIFDTINIGLIFVDDNNEPHMYISMEKFNKIKPFISNKQYYTYMSTAIEYLKQNIKEIKSNFFESAYLFLNRELFCLNEVDWLSHITDDKFENKFEMYEYLFKLFVYDNLRADKIHDIFES